MFSPAAGAKDPFFRLQLLDYGAREHQIQSARIIVEGCFKTQSQPLNNESLRKSMTEVEIIINSRPVTVWTISGLTNWNSKWSSNQAIPLHWKPDVYSKRDVYNLFLDGLRIDGGRNLTRVYKQDKMKKGYRIWSWWYHFIKRWLIANEINVKSMHINRVGVQRVKSYLTGRRYLFSFSWSPS